MNPPTTFVNNKECGGGFLSISMKRRLLKPLAFGLLGLIIILLMIATVVEKLQGSTFAQQNIYTVWWMVLLWGAMALLSFFYLVQQRLYRQIATFALHLSFLLIIIGAFVTHRYGVQGTLHLRKGDNPVSEFRLTDETTQKFPFSVELQGFELQYYEGTFAPMDYVSSINITDGEKRIAGRVSMNNIFKHRGYRLYQSGYDKDGKGTTLSVAYDPYGIGITYAGYLSLLLSMLGFFFQPNSVFRQLLCHPALRKGTIGIVALLCTVSVSAAPRTLPRDVAEEFGNLHVYYNDRICPVETLARDFTAKLYGKTSYQGLSPQQVLVGWFFFYDDWKREPMIKIKGADVQNILGVEDSYASLVDFTDKNGYKLDTALQSGDLTTRRNAESANEKFNLVSMLCTGSLLKIYPYADGQNAPTMWYSLADQLPKSVPYEQWLFICNSMNMVAEQVAMKDYDEVKSLLGKIRKYQLREAEDDLPAEWLFEAEKLYNSANYNRLLAMMSLCIGVVCFVLFGVLTAQRRLQTKAAVVCRIILWVICFYLSAHIIMRGLIAGYVPLSNGFETMQFMAWCSVVLTLVFGRRFRMALPFGYLLCGFTLLVAMMGEATPKITQLMPVLQSPLLSIHVVVIMIAYTLLAFMMLNGVTALIIHFTRPYAKQEIESLYILSRLMLYPALFLLVAGIFIGAVWANISWGRYWGWDPKEVWALITMLVYASALHSSSLSLFRRPMFFHVFCIVAFITVLITYFGVNFLLGGMHSYA